MVVSCGGDVVIVVYGVCAVYGVARCICGGVYVHGGGVAVCGVGLCGGVGCVGMGLRGICG